MSADPSARRRRVREVQEAARRLQMVENWLSDLDFRVPVMRREIGDIRRRVDRALAGQDPEPISEFDGAPVGCHGA